MAVAQAGLGKPIPFDVNHLDRLLDEAGIDSDKPLQAGMVLSIETTMNHPRRGLVKIENTVLVTETGWQGLGDGVRGWQRTAG